MVLPEPDDAAVSDRAGCGVILSPEGLDLELVLLSSAMGDTRPRPVRSSAELVLIGISLLV